MPKVFTFKGYKFFFFSNEGIPREPVHIHVRQAERLAKFWIEPEVEIAASYGFSASEINTLLKVVDERRSEIKEKWYEFFGE